LYLQYSLPTNATECLKRIVFEMIYCRPSVERDVKPRNYSLTHSLTRAGFNWWEAWGPVYLGGTERLQQLYD